MPGTRREFFRGALAPGDPCDGGPAPEPSLAVHALNRLAYGPRDGDLERVESIGYDAYLAEQLAPDLIDDSACDARLAALPRATLSESWAQLYDRRNVEWLEVIRPITETRHAHFTRRLHSERQLLERMVDFWHDHFNIYGFEYIVRSMWPKWDETIRVHALGNFRAFLETTAQHPCMLYYLDNYISTDAGPNENYARELFELHSFGAINYQTAGGYIDQDVYESSRCFTGWTFDRDSESPLRGQFEYVHEDHDRFIKFVLGTMIPNDQPPLKDGRDVLDMIAFNPGTLRHLAFKLAVKFVDDDPPESVVASTADVLLANTHAPDQVRLALAHLLASEEFKAARMTKFKRPLDWTVSMMRALGMDYIEDDTFLYVYNNLGQPVYSWRPPDGPPDERAHWATSNAMMQRWNMIYRIASGWYDDDGLAIPMEGAMPPGLETPRDFADFWASRTMRRPLSSATSNALMEFVAEGRNPDLPMPADQAESKARYLAALCVMTPEFQRR